MRNIEIKVTVSDRKAVVDRLLKLGATYQYTMKQSDYYFGVGDTKEKLRVIDDHEYQLITYHRVEKHGQKDSKYDIKMLNAKETKDLLSHRKTLKKIEKKRELWLFDNTRIHIDQVEHLGDFLELETVINGISPKAGEREFWTVVEWLGIDVAHSIAGSYSDLVPV